jgi:hypothetical protein
LKEALGKENLYEIGNVIGVGVLKYATLKVKYSRLQWSRNLIFIKTLGLYFWIIEVNFGVKDQSLIGYSAFPRYWRKMNNMTVISQI